MNLIRDSWIPIRRQSGRRERVAPWQLSEAEDPIVGLASPRPDFDGALAQLWIGLLQTAFAPADSREWRERLREPPKPEELRAAFEPIAHAFELLGDGPRFLQDLGLPLEGEIQTVEIERLLLERLTAPGTDHFARLGVVHALCLSCAACALASAQTNSPSGGRGYRIGLRGGGPLTTLVWAGRELFHSLWLNVLPEGQFLGLTGNAELDRPEDKFPWLARTRTSEQEVPLETTPEDAHPAQVFFSMPRRIRLLTGPQGQASRCDLCEEPANASIVAYATRNYGVKYSGPWRHPLTPYRRDKEGGLISIKGNHSTVSYRNYLGLVQSDSIAQIEPAAVLQRVFSTSILGRQIRLWAFGFEIPPMQAKTSAWCEGTMPLWQLPPETRPRFEEEVARWVKAARYVVGELSFSVKLLFARRPKDVKGSLEGVTLRFWQATEPAFYAALAGLADRVQALVDTGAESSATLEPEREEWRQHLAEAAKEIFNHIAQAGHFEGGDPRRVAEAWQRLSFGVGPYNKKLRDVLSLPALETPAKRAKVRAKAAAA